MRPMTPSIHRYGHNVRMAHAAEAWEAQPCAGERSMAFIDADIKPFHFQSKAPADAKHKPVTVGWKAGHQNGRPGFPLSIGLW